MNVSLTPQLAGFVRAAISSGMYNNASELMREALRRMKFEADRRSGDFVEDAAETSARIKKSAAAVKRGEFTDYDASGLRAFGRKVIGDIRKQAAPRKKS